MIDVAKNNFITQLCKDVALPRMIRVRQLFDEDCLRTDEIRQTVLGQLSREEISSQIRPGMRIGITVGSRGVANIALIAKAIVDYVKGKDALPFIFPAMGSHGGATAEGQLEVIKSYGVTESAMGCPILSSMETVEIGTRPDGKPIYMGKTAHEADGIILCGRIKAHTAFRGPYESGLLKMAVIGMGKQHGADTVHESGFSTMAELLPTVARVVFDNVNILCGLGVIENAHDRTYQIHGLTPREIFEKEPGLLLLAKQKMARLLFKDIDVLIIDRIGKDISGDGMDPNVTGRFLELPPEDFHPRVQRIVVLGLTAATHHNANGIGFADISTRRLLSEMDLDTTYPNAVTSTLLPLARIPLIAENDKVAVQLGIRSCNRIDRAAPRVIHIRDTMHIDEIEISESMLAEALKDPRIEVLDSPKEWRFDAQDSLL